MGGVHNDVFAWMVDACVPEGGCAVIFGEVYVDESGTHDGSPMLTIGGYLFEREQARKFSRDWARDLATIPLPCAHMTDCANGNGDYAELEMEDRVRSEKLLIQNIKRRTRFGFGVSVDPKAYASIVGAENGAPSAYTYALQSCFVILRRWAARTGFQGKLTYFFESGHASEAEANRYISSALLKSDASKAKNFYAGHAFMDKKDALPLQAADMLAWQFHHYHARKKLHGITKPRADFDALIRPQDVVIQHTEDDLRRFKATIIDEGWRSETM